MVDDGYVPPLATPIKVMGYYAMGGVDAQLPVMKAAGFITPHMGHIARTIAYVLSGGDTPQNGMISEDYMLSLEREAFVELWKTESTRKMAEHMATKGKPLMI